MKQKFGFLHFQLHAPAQIGRTDQAPPQKPISIYEKKSIKKA